MIRSMTGYGRARKVIEGTDITVEIKSVNHRYFDFSSRTPRTYGFLDEKLKSYKVETVTTQVPFNGSNTTITGNVYEVYTDNSEAIVQENADLTVDSSSLGKLKKTGLKNPTFSFKLVSKRREYI